MASRQCRCAARNTPRSQSPSRRCPLPPPAVARSSSTGREVPQALNPLLAVAASPLLSACAPSGPWASHRRCKKSASRARTPCLLAGYRAAPAPRCPRRRPPPRWDLSQPRLAPGAQPRQPHPAPQAASAACALA
eukprot:3338566-Prymnesium_polylepis.2